MNYESLSLNGVTKVNESISPDKIAQTELQQLTNMVLSKAGNVYNPRKRGGFRGVYSSATQKMGLRPYWADIVEDGAGSKIPLAIGYTGTVRQLRAYFSGAWNALTTPATTLLGGNTLPLRYTRFNKQLYITDLNGPAFILGGTNFGSSYTLEIERPDISAIRVYTYATVGSLEANKNVAYIITFGDDAGNESLPSQPIYIAFPPATDYQVKLENIPAPTDTRVTKIIIYRTEGDGKVFYRHSTLEQDTTKLTDNKTLLEFDDPGATITFKQVPKKSMYVATHRDRVWWGSNTVELANPYSPPFIQHTTPTASSGWTAQPNIAKQDGTAGGTSYSAQGGSIADATPGTGLEVDSFYKWYVYSKSVRGEWSRDRMIIIGKTAGASKLPFAFPCWPSMIGASALIQDDCSMIKVFRTKKQTSLANAQGATSLYEVGTFDTAGAFGLDTETTTHYGGKMFWDVTDDTALTVAFVAPTNTDEVRDSEVAFSDLAKPNTYLYEDRRPVDADNDGKITGIFDDGNGLIIFKERAIYKIFTTGSKWNWELIKLVENIGCTDPYSLAKSGSVYFFRFGKTFYLWQSGMTQPQEISKDFRKTTEWITSAFASVATEKYYAVSAGYNDEQGGGNVASIYIFDFASGSWLTFQNASMVAEVLFADKFSDPIYGTINAVGFNNLLGAVVTTNNGYLVKYAESNTQDENYAGTAQDITGIIKFKKFIFPDEFYVARLREFFLKILRDGSSAVTVILSADDASQTLTFTTGTSSIFSRNISDSELHRCRNLTITLSGVGLSEFKSLRLDYRPERRDYGR